MLIQISLVYLIKDRSPRNKAPSYQNTLTRRDVSELDTSFDSTSDQNDIKISYK